jgi:hypothetical protein
MTAQRKVGQRGYEKDEPRDIVLKLRLTQTEADILNEIAERANRPTTKIIMSALNTMFYLGAVTHIFIPEAEKSNSETKEYFDNQRLKIKELKKTLADKAQNGDKSFMIALTAMIEIETNLLRFAKDSTSWIDFEKERTPLDWFNL